MKGSFFIKKSLAKKFVALMGIFIASFIIGATLFLVTLNLLNESYISTRDELRAKQEIIEEMNNVFNKVFFDARGYFAYGNTELKENALAQESKIKDLSQKFKKLSVTKEDRLLIGKVDKFNNYYFHVILPQIIFEYEAGHIEEVERIANNEAIEDVVQFQESMGAYLQKLDRKLELHYQQLTKIQKNIQLAFLLFILLILLLLLRIIRIMFRQIGQPLSKLAYAANEIANGNDSVIQISGNQEDEIDALSKAFQKMVERVREKEQALRARNEELKFLVQLKSELVSTVSHELRTPLASILGFTELLLQRDIKPERREKYLTTILNEAKRLTALINDFLDIQKMEAGKQSYKKEYITLLPLLDKVIDFQQVNTKRHAISLESFIKDPIILGDQEKLEQVFTNLINNAIKYSPEGGNIKVEVSQTAKELKVAIMDYGLGIPVDAIDQLFTKFYRVDNSDRRKIGGTGLGLVIVEEIVKAHDGRVTVQSELGKGSRFTVIFPIVHLS
jgi:signal transduction histidine kinase